MSSRTTAPTTDHVLSEQEILDLRQAIFRRREISLDAAGRQIGTPSLLATLAAMRSGMRPLLESLPEAAFAPQPANAAGDLDWSAAQTFAHVCDIQVHLWGAWLRAAANLPAGVTLESHADDHAAYPHLSRTACLALDDTCTAELRETLQALGPQPDPGLGSSMENPWVRTLAETLVMFCIHEQDHLAQLRHLAAD